MRFDQFTIEDTLAKAPSLTSSYEEHVADISLSPKAIAFSEMLFFCATIAGTEPRQIVESGRAQGTSTLILGRMFPDTQIVSIEYDPNSHDAAVAHKRLKDLPNVAPIFGDARQVLEALTLPKDIVLIDGPKRFRALRLALRLLANLPVRAVFLHDYRRGLPEREFLQQAIPEAFYSDDKAFIDKYAYLDQSTIDYQEERNIDEWRPYLLRGEPQESYGATLACIPYNKDRSYVRVLAKAAAKSNIDRMMRSIGKRRGGD